RKERLELRPEFDESDRNKLVKQVMHDEPVRPRKLNPGVPRDLETVVLKAIARDPAHRYQTPAAMAEDLKRFVEDRPIRARRVSEAEKFWRWCRRNPLPASLLAGIVLVFLAGFAGVSWQWREAAPAREDEKRQRAEPDSWLGVEFRPDAAARGNRVDRGIQQGRQNRGHGQFGQNGALMGRPVRRATRRGDGPRRSRGRHCVQPERRPCPYR